MRGLDLVMGFAIMGLCAGVSVGLVTARQQVQAQGRQIAVLEEQLTALYIAADWGVPAPGLDDGQWGVPAAAGIDAVPVKRPKVTKPAGVGEGVL